MPFPKVAWSSQPVQLSCAGACSVMTRSQQQAPARVGFLQGSNLVALSSLLRGCACVHFFRPLQIMLARVRNCDAPTPTCHVVISPIQRLTLCGGASAWHELEASNVLCQGGSCDTLCAYAVPMRCLCACKAGMNAGMSMRRSGMWEHVEYGPMWMCTVRRSTTAGGPSQWKWLSSSTCATLQAGMMSGAVCANSDSPE